MPWKDEWGGLADFLANMIEKYAGEMDLDTLPDPDNNFKMRRIKEMYRKYMRLSAQARKASLVLAEFVRKRAIIQAG